MPNEDVTRRRFITTASGTLLAAAAAPVAGQLAPPDKQPPKLKLPETKKKLGYAIVGLGQLALEQILPAFGQCERSKPVALVSGHVDKAKKTAAAYGIDEKSIYTYDTFDDLAKNDAIDVVYIVLPNHMHAEFTIRALKATKHVLCEKPMAATSEECRKMIAAAKENERQLMIAYRLHYEPHHLKAIELCREKIGALKTIDATNNQNVDAPNIRLSKATAGGPVGDTGVYCINAARYLSGEEPIEVSAFAHQPKDDPRFAEVHESVSWQSKFPSGLIATSACSFGTSELRRFDVSGSKGSISMQKAFGYNGQRLILNVDGMSSDVDVPNPNHFTSEMDAFSEAIVSGEPNRTPGEEGLRDMLIVEAIHKSIAANGATVNVAGLVKD
jgi:predicted dehydrogenase